MTELNLNQVRQNPSSWWRNNGCNIVCLQHNSDNQRGCFFICFFPNKNFTSPKRKIIRTAAQKYCKFFKSAIWFTQAQNIFGPYQMTWNNRKMDRLLLIRLIALTMCLIDLLNFLFRSWKKPVCTQEPWLSNRTSKIHFHCCLSRPEMQPSSSSSALYTHTVHNAEKLFHSCHRQRPKLQFGSQKDSLQYPESKSQTEK